MAYTSGRLFAGQKTGIGTGAVQIDTTITNIRECLIQADSTNTTALLVGDSLGQYVSLTAGQSITIPILSLRLVYVKMATGTGIANWIARD